MPRTGRGGKVSAAPGKVYSNRADLNKPEPITTVPGQDYGKAAEQQAAQRAIPMSSQPVSTAPPSVPNPVPAPQAQNAPLSAPAVNPGDINLFGPTERPEEPITAGIPSGPGPSSIPGSGPGMQQNTVADLINNLAAHPLASPEIRQLAALVNRGVL